MTTENANNNIAIVGAGLAVSESSLKNTMKITEKISRA
jgi:hypothetical protein